GRGPQRAPEERGPPRGARVLRQPRGRAARQRAPAGRVRRAAAVAALARRRRAPRVAVIGRPGAAGPRVLRRRSSHHHRRRGPARDEDTPQTEGLGMNERVRVVVITGLSGAGKSTALHSLEDLGYFCVDNLPTALLERTVEVCEAGGIRRIALGV